VYKANEKIDAAPNITLPDLENVTTLDGLHKKHFEERP